ncbi:cardiolipin synthase [Pseudobacteriovorax antillogorgiicola]|uniref:Cardiolipin synthase n=1 Tax=Pseudobacteriovorax antillogorgiicola TaxID=1513793 RepID=A0A1Y6BKC2_9BACT|nr:cardiolipin synthase [Pseudobacteriovorax antillogorgiicola]TCS56430.1 cardiolipin synthase [Pseudobacteriovorax antillogorgiicola]SMF05589.1 cardiolipin synthase [Pseudobacteriovorax antillogorgiicola]
MIDIFQPVDAVIYSVLIGCVYALAIRNVWAIVSSEMNPSAAATWILINISFPFLGVPLYFFLGQSKLRLYSKRRRKRLKGRNHDYPPLTSYNKIHLLTSGQGTFDEIFAEIENAKDYILIQYYIFRTDRLGLKFIDLLIKKAQQGVKVFFLYDNLGSLGLTGTHTRNMKQNGIYVARFLPLRIRFNFQINFRNHRKIIVIDGHKAFMGGMNVGVEYLGIEKHWRDTQLKIEGPGCAQFSQTFADDWSFAASPKYREPLDTALDHRSEHIPQGPCATKVYSFGPGDDLDYGLYLFMNLIQNAKESIYIATPYLIPDLVLERCLELAIIKDIKVVIIVPERTDSIVVQIINNHYVRRLCHRGAQIYLYQAGFMHQKVVLVDQEKALVGSSNFDNRSIYLNFETSVLVENESFSLEVYEMLMNDISRSEQLEVNKIRFVERHLGNILRIASPLF